MKTSRLLPEAQRLAAAGFSIVPVKADKRPLGSWSRNQQMIDLPEVLLQRFSSSAVTGHAVITGEVSGGLLSLDFDLDKKGEATEPFDLETEFVEPWLEAISKVIDPATLPRQRTGSGGFQFFVRCPNPGGNVKLARIPANNKQGFHAVIETRGQGGYALLPPSLHPSGTTYAWQHLDLTDVPQLTSEQLGAILDAARALDRMPLDVGEQRRLTKGYERRQGEQDEIIRAFNEKYDPTVILERNGYTLVRGKYLSPDSTSGNPGVTVFQDAPLIYSHHTDTLGDGRAHDAFDVFAYLEHGGDKKVAYEAAGRELSLWHERHNEHGNVTPARESANDETANLIVTRKVEPFPLEVFPEPLVRLVSEAAAALPCPPDFLGVPLLGLMGAAIGTSRVVEPKTGWREGPRSFLAIVADPGSKKSPALAAVASPFHDRQRAAYLAYTEEKKVYERELAEFEQAKIAWRAAARGKDSNPGRMPTPPTEPVMAQCFTTDATLEALAALHEDNPRSLMFLQDELSGWVKAMNQYKGGKGNDRQKWLSFWSGSSEVINRKGKEPVVLPNPFINVAGCIPPDVLGELSDEAGREDGFIHRILFCYPEPVKLKWTEAIVSGEARSGYERVMAGLWRLEPELEGTQPSPKVLRFTEAGKTAFVEWISAHYREMNAPGFSGRLRGPWAKMEGYVSRLALVLQLARYAAGEAQSEEVDEVSAYGAAALMDYFKSHTRRVYAEFHSSEEDKALRSIYRYLERQPKRQGSIRNLVRSGVGGIKDTRAAKEKLKLLKRRGLGDFIEIHYVSGQRGDGFALLRKDG